MAEEIESNDARKEREEASREGYSTTGQESYHRSYQGGVGRTQRPRIHSQRAYSASASTSSDEGGFRPEGFGAVLASSSSEGEGRQGGYRPRINNNYGGGYQQRGGYQSRQQGSYRPRYNANNEEGQEGVQQREGYQGREGGYQPRGSYQQRGGYQNRQQGGYRPRYNNNSEGGYGQQQGGYRSRYTANASSEEGQENSYQQREGGYQPREGGYQPRQGGYQSRQGGYGQRQGGYGQQRQGGYNNNRGGYGQRQGGYGQQRQGGYNNRGGYNNNRGGYGQQGGYNQGGYRQRSADYDPNAKYSLKKRIEYKEEHIDPTEPLRLNKFLANAGVCSRREADDFILAGQVTVNGEVINELGTKILRTDEVKFQDKLVSLEKKVYVLLNKPKDYVTTSDDPQQRKTVMDLVKDACPERIYPVGRLDRNTTGVLLFTNDGDLASKLTHPKFLKKKVYHVFLDKPITANELQKISDGIELEDGEIKADAIEYANPEDQAQVGIEIHSGKNRIVRRIFESLGYRVVKLDRVMFAGLTKKNVRRGDWRFLTEKEVEMLRMGAFE
ncbi:pseudouridine synthase [Prevotella bivia DNF00320]|uniref:Pseudouridine synthase n=1 Tax=Prevotella bivia DNF00320 TaxID=1401068 RepID=A0A096BMS2_9BACT|nr:pseudouridine synthase [Prevotella bivia]KGF44007.1 pseudouridine synthase [Prevotella bivia DNF00320]